MTTPRGGVPCLFPVNATTGWLRIFTLVKRRQVTILKHTENYFNHFFHFAISSVSLPLWGLLGGWCSQVHIIFVKLYGFTE